MRKWMVWVPGMLFGLYTGLTSFETHPGWALFDMFFAGANFGCLFVTYTRTPDDPSNSTQGGWASKKRRD